MSCKFIYKEETIPRLCGCDAAKKAQNYVFMLCPFKHEESESLCKFYVPEQKPKTIEERLAELEKKVAEFEQNRSPAEFGTVISCGPNGYAWVETTLDNLLKVIC